MELKDALTVTVLGMSVVFIGLILTSLMIYSFSFIPWLKSKFSKSNGDAALAAEPVIVTAEGPVNVEPEVLAVITTVLEAEFRKMALLEGKYTFK